MLCHKCGKNEATVRVYYEVNGVMIHGDFCEACVPVKRCDCCGSSFDDILKSGKCGCPHCYEKFYEKLLPRIKNVQGGRIEHTGKTPNAGKSSEDQTLILKEQLKTLIAEEKYEEAAVVRDKIKNLEAKF